MTLRLWLLLVLLAGIWGSSFLFGRIAVQEIPPLPLVLYRVGLAAACLWGFLWVAKRKPTFDTMLLSNLAIMALLNNVLPFSLILYGQQEIGSGLAAIVNAMTPIWTVLIAHVFTSDEKLSIRKLLGIAAGFIGVGVLIGADALSGLAASAWAQLSVLGATICYGLSSVFGKRFKGHDPVIIATGQLTASSIVMALMILVTGASVWYPDASGLTWLSVAGIAILCTALAYILFFRILSEAGAVNVSLVTFLVPVSAILLGMVFLDETLESSQIVGMALIAIGLLILDGRLFGRKPALK